MHNQIDTLYKKTISDLARLDKERDKLLIQKATLEAVGATLQTKIEPLPPKSKVQAEPGRAPKGAIQKAVLSILSKADRPRSIAEVKDLLENSGYPHKITTMHVRKTLKRMVKAKQLSGKLDGNLSYYELIQSS